MLSLLFNHNNHRAGFDVTDLFLSLFLLLPLSVNGEDKITLELLETRQKETRAAFAKQEKTMSGLRHGLAKLNLENRAATASLDGLRTHMKGDAVKLHENLSRATANSERLDKIFVNLEEIETKLRQVKLKQPRKSMHQEQAGQGSAPLPHSSSPVEDIPAFRLLVATLLVFLAPLGFTLLEASCLATWAIPLAGMRNLVVSIVIVLTYFTLGYGLMYGQSGFTMTSGDPSENAIPAAFFLYQLGLVMMAGLIVTTTLSDRLTLAAYALIAITLSGFLYPVFGQWIWGSHLLLEHKGWLEERGFRDFAGASVLSVTAAGFALIWAGYLRKVSTATPPEVTNPPPAAYNPSYALPGLFILWLSWMGLLVGHLKDEEQIALLIVKLSLAGAAAGCVAFIQGVIAGKQQDVQHETYIKPLGGILSGFVAIAAAADTVTTLEAIVMGSVAGLLHVPACRLLQRRVVKHDAMTVNLIAAHGVGGIWGTLCVALYGGEGQPDVGQLVVQWQGVMAALILSVSMALISVLLYRGMVRLGTARKVKMQVQAASS